MPMIKKVVDQNKNPRENSVFCCLVCFFFGCPQNLRRLADLEAVHCGFQLCLGLLLQRCSYVCIHKLLEFNLILFFFSSHEMSSQLNSVPLVLQIWPKSSIYPHCSRGLVSEVHQGCLNVLMQCSEDTGDFFLLMTLVWVQLNS